MQREFRITQDCNVENVIFASYGKKKKKNRGKKQQKETQKHYHVIVAENNLFKGFTAEDIRNYDQEY